MVRRAAELHGGNYPVVMVDEEDFVSIDSGQWVTVNPGGVIESDSAS